jgi:aminopeptidase 2
MSSLDVLSSTYRLPLGVKPTHYELTVRTDLKELTFQGLVKIELVFSVSSLCSNLQWSEYSSVWMWRKK